MKYIASTGLKVKLNVAENRIWQVRNYFTFMKVWEVHREKNYKHIIP